MAVQWQGQTGIGIETVYGTAVPPTRYLPVQVGNSETTPIRMASEEARGSRYEYRDELQGLDYNLHMELWAHPTHIGEILYCTLGASVAVLLTGSEYQHTITPALTLPSFTLHLDRAVGASPTSEIVGCKINTLAIESLPRDILKLTIDGFAQKQTDQAAITPVDADFPTIRPLQWNDLSYTQGLNGSAPAADTTLERFMLEINNNLITDKVTANGDLFIDSLPEGVLMVTGAFDKEFESLSDYAAFVADQQYDTVNTWTGPSMGTNNYLLTVDVPNARLTALPKPQISGTSERGMYTTEFKGLYNPGDSRVIAMILNNMDSDITD